MLIYERHLVESSENWKEKNFDKLKDSMTLSEMISQRRQKSDLTVNLP